MASTAESAAVSVDVSRHVQVRSDELLRPLVADALDRGLQQVRATGAAVQPFLLSADGAFDYLFGGDHCHPIDLAARLLLSGSRASDVDALALVMGTRLTTPAGRQSQVVLVLACSRHAVDGEVWAQAYRPQRWYRAFAEAGAPWRVGVAVNLFRAIEQPVTGSDAGSGYGPAPLMLKL